MLVRPSMPTSAGSIHSGGTYSRPPPTGTGAVGTRTPHVGLAAQQHRLRRGQQAQHHRAAVLPLAAEVEPHRAHGLQLVAFLVGEQGHQLLHHVVDGADHRDALHQPVQQARGAALQAGFHQQAEHIDAGQQQQHPQHIANGFRCGDAQAHGREQAAKGALRPQPGAEEAQRPGQQQQRGHQRQQRQCTGDEGPHGVLDTWFHA